ncbi:hypothetical protein RD792_004162 [Penstemon davidsonii]|uniref:Filament-like plant protein 7 n=1 Tax=Penstemon davidsonii TaxID=160366 RepID=A0ABR0DH82_9LAMI|nr:hypothetical protein RD792_004162 [Penstemon davidsonii]
MDQKSWLWKKRSTEKTLLADKANNSLSKNEEVTEVQELLTEKAELERDLRILNEKLSTALSDCNTKDSITKKQVKIAQEAIAGWEKAKTEAISLTKELDKVLQQKAASEERLGHLDAALKECMQQLRFVREEQEQRVHGAVAKTSEEFDKTRIALDEKLAEGNKRLAKLDAENIQLSKALSGKDKLIEDLSKYRAKLEADFNNLKLRVESTEKENASLKYEIRVLEKELDIRNEEREFVLRTADVAQKQQHESVKKIAKLESECQRLRLLVRKRLPGPAALTRMKNEVQMLGSDQVVTRRRSNPSIISSMDFRVDVEPYTPSKKINFLTEQLHTMEEENQSLRDALNNKTSELPFSKTMYSPTASRLSRIERQVEESLKGQTNSPTASRLQNHGFLRENSIAASSDMGSDDKASCAESWASALLSELEHFKSEKQLSTPSHRNMGTSDMSLMDDFAEMEKLAVVSVDYPAGSSHYSSEEGIAKSGGHSSPAPGRDCSSEPLIFSHKVPGQLHDMVKMVFDHSKVSKRNPFEVLEDMKVTLTRYSSDTTVFYGKGSINKSEASNSPQVSGHVFQTSSDKSLNLYASDAVNGHNISNMKKSDQKYQPHVSISIHKILELLEGISIPSQDISETPNGYVVRMFQWKKAELYAILQQFVQTCNDVLKGTADLEQFAQQVASNLDWIMNHCFSLQDVSSMKDAIRNHMDWDESRSESEVDSGSANHSVESNRLHIPREDMPYLPMLSPLSGHNSSCPNTNVELVNNESSNVDLEGRFPSVQLQEFKDIKVKPEMETMKHSNGKTGDESENQKMMKEDIENQPVKNHFEGGEACQKISLENKLKNKSNSSGSKSSKELQDLGKHWEKQFQNDWEITAASEKLAECQETILNLGKQLKALSTPKDAALLDKVLSTPSDTVATSMSSSRRNISQRSSLLDKMLAEDNHQVGASSRTQDDIQNQNSYAATESKFANLNENNKDDNKITAPSMAIVPKKNGGKSFFKKLFSRQKRGNIKKTSLC